MFKWLLRKMGVIGLPEPSDFTYMGDGRIEIVCGGGGYPGQDKTINPEAALAKAEEYIDELVTSEAVTCPVCEQFVTLVEKQRLWVSYICQLCDCKFTIHG